MLFIAAEKGDVSGIASALTLGVSVNAVNGDGETALMHAIICGKGNAVKYLLSKGADITMRDGKGWSAATYAVVDENEEFVRLLAEMHKSLTGKNLDLEITELERGYTLLMLAVDLESVSMVKLLLAMGAKTDSADKNGVSLVQQAIAVKNAEIIDLIISGGNLESLKEIERKVEDALKDISS